MAWVSGYIQWAGSDSFPRQRYPEIFPDEEKIRLMQKNIEKSIGKSLTSRTSLLKVHPLKSRNPKKLINDDGPVIIPHALYWRTNKQ